MGNKQQLINPLSRVPVITSASKLNEKLTLTQKKANIIYKKEDSINNNKKKHYYHLIHIQII